MLADGTITLQLRATGGRGALGDAQLVYPRGRLRHQSILTYLGGTAFWGTPAGAALVAGDQPRRTESTPPQGTSRSRSIPVHRPNLLRATYGALRKRLAT